MKSTYLKHRFQFAVPVDYSDEKAIIAKIGSIIGDKNMRIGLGILNVEEFDCIRTTIITNRVGKSVFEDTDAYPYSLRSVMDDSDLSFAMDETLYDGRVVEYNKKGKQVSSNLEQVFELASENMSNEQYEKFCRDLRFECDTEIYDDLISVDCKIEKKAAKRVDFKSSLFKYSIYLLDSEDGVIVAYEKLPGLFSDRKMDESKDLKHPLNDAIQGMSYEELKALRKSTHAELKALRKDIKSISKG